MKITIKQFIEYVGVISIVASLIFVGMQLSLDRSMALAEVYVMRTDTRKEDLRALLESETALAEIAEHRDRGLIHAGYNLPESWRSEEDPKMEVARRIRSELLLLNWDTIIYLSSIEMYDIEETIPLIESVFRTDPGLMEFALNGPRVHDSTREVFEELRDKIENQ